MKKILSTAIIIVMAVLSLVGCGTSKGVPDFNLEITNGGKTIQFNNKDAKSIALEEIELSTSKIIDGIVTKENHSYKGYSLKAIFAKIDIKSLAIDTITMKSKPSADGKVYSKEIDGEVLDNIYVAVLTKDSNDKWVSLDTSMGELRIIVKGSSDTNRWVKQLQKIEIKYKDNLPEVGDYKVEIIDGETKFAFNNSIGAKLTVETIKVETEKDGTKTVYEFKGYNLKKVLDKLEISNTSATALTAQAYAGSDGKVFQKDFTNIDLNNIYLVMAIKNSEEQWVKLEEKHAPVRIVDKSSKSTSNWVGNIAKIVIN